MTDNVAVVAIPGDVHRNCSETYAGRNNSQVETATGRTMKRSERDSLGLESAVELNWDANVECLKKDYGLSNEEAEDIRARLHELNKNAGWY